MALVRAGVEEPMKKPHPLRSLRTRFVVAMSVMLIPLVVVAVVAFVSLEGAIRGVDDVVEAMTAEIVPVAELQRQILEARIPLQTSLHEDSPESRERFKRMAREANRLFEQLVTTRTPLRGKVALVGSAREEWVRAQRIANEAISAPHPGVEPALASDIMERFDSCVERAMGDLATFSGQARQGIREMLAQAHEIRLRGILTNAVVLGVALVVALLAGFALAGSILRPLQALAEGVRRIGEGDLSHRVVLASRDEIGQLARAFNAMTGRLETSQATLEVLSLRDGLTGLYNYREFRRRLKEEVDRSRRYGRPFSLLLLDLDHFKAVNDAHGHQAGDEVLREIANRIGQGVRPVDSVARYGGEEITIILPETAGSKAVVVGERIRGLIAVHPITIPGGATVRLTVSVGVAAFGEDGASDNDIISAADSALYAAKRAGRNRVCRLTRPDQSPPSPA